MITNLFSIFDPATPSFLALNWVSILIVFILSPISLWVIPSRFKFVLNSITFYIYREFKPLIKKRPFTLIFTSSLFSFIIFNNVIGLLPYIFTASSHIVFSISLALPIWLALILFRLSSNISNFLVHLIPQGTPSILTPFIVVIETIRNIIRPITLAIRLSANIIAGHLLIVLLRSATPLTPLLFIPILLLAQIALSTLEIAVAFIQSYVFRVLITLYTAESII